MASIRARQKADGKISYQAVVRITGQPTLRETFSDINKARAWSDAMSAAARASIHKLPDIKSYRRVNLKNALTQWSTHETCPKTYTSLIPSVIRLVGDIALAHVTQEYVLAYINRVRKTNSQFNRPYTDVTILKHLAAMRGAVKFIAKRFNVKPDLSMFSIEEVEGKWKVERKRVLSKDEEARLHGTIPTRTYDEHWALLIDFAIETVAREGELVLMELSEIDYEKRVWTIPKEHTKMKYEREVPLSKKATAIALKLRNLLNDHNAILSNNPDSKKPQETRLFHVFSTPSSVCSGFAKLAKAASINNFTFHDLRHTGITRLTLNKRHMKVEEIMAIAGHKSYAMYLKYSNLRGEDLVDRME
jgi:integrase